MWFLPPRTPLLYSKTEVCRGIRNFLISTLKHRLGVLVRIASLRRFKRVPIIEILNRNKKKYQIGSSNFYQCIWIGDFTLWPQDITETYLYNFDPLKPHFYTVKLGFTGVYITFLISAQNIGCEYSLEPPRRGGSNEYPQPMFRAEIWKISDFFIWKLAVFWWWNVLYIWIGVYS